MTSGWKRKKDKRRGQGFKVLTDLSIGYELILPWTFGNL